MEACDAAAATFAAIREVVPGFQIAGVVMGPIRSVPAADLHSLHVRHLASIRSPDSKTLPVQSTPSGGNIVEMK